MTPSEDMLAIIEKDFYALRLGSETHHLCAVCLADDLAWLIARVRSLEEEIRQRGWSTLSWEKHYKELRTQEEEYRAVINFLDVRIKTLEARNLAYEQRGHDAQQHVLSLREQYSNREDSTVRTVLDILGGEVIAVRKQP